MGRSTVNRWLIRESLRALALAALVTPGAQSVYSQSTPAFRSETCATRPHATEMPGQITESVITLKILLVQFADVHCAAASDGVTPRYTARDFEDMLGSTGVYVSPEAHSPDGDDVCGSLSDYYRSMSGGRLTVRARVLNSVDGSGRPVWVTLPMKKSEYQRSDVVIFYDATDAADAAGMDFSVSDTTRIAIIYAGNTYFGLGGLNPMALGLAYIMSEVQGRPYGCEHADAKFARIGIHCHEFGHTIGIGHTTGGRADVMCGGMSNGSVEGNAPASLNPIARARLGWANVVPVQGETPVIADLPYGLSNPTVYVLKNGAGDVFYVENRRFDRMMTIGATAVPDYNNVAFFPPAGPHHAITQGIFVWRLSATGDSRDPGYSTEGLVYASGRYGRTYPENDPSDTDDGVPFPGVSGNRLLSPWSDPRNPYIKEMDWFGSTTWHYTLCVPNTKGGSVGGMEVLSEDRTGGTFTVRLYPAAMPNPALAGCPAADSMGAYDGRRTVLMESSGAKHQVMGIGGEVFYRRSPAGSRAWNPPVLLSQGNGGNSVPSLARSGGNLLVSWQMDGYDAADSGRGIYLARSMDDGATWSAYVNVGWSYRCGAPGAFPVLAGASDGTAILAFRSEGLPVSIASCDAGASWSPPVPVPLPGIDWSGVSLACSGASVQSAEALLAFRTHTASEDPRVGVAGYSFPRGAWYYVRTLSVPPVFTGSRNPNIVAGPAQNASASLFTIDASDAFDAGRPVILGFPAGSVESSHVLTVRRGAVQNDFTVAQLGAAAAPGAPGATQSRSVSVWDSAAGTAMEIELGGVMLHHRTGTCDTLSLAPLLTGSAPADPCSLFSTESSVAFALAEDIDSVLVPVDVYARQAADLLAPDSGGVDVGIVRDGGNSAACACVTVALPLRAGGERRSWLLSVPASRLMSVGNASSYTVRLFAHGFRQSGSLSGAVCEIFGASARRPVGVLAVNSGPRAGVPSGFSLAQNYPNPFNPTTTVRYVLPQKSRVTITVYTMLGQTVATLVDGLEEAGAHEVRFDARGVASGTYICRLHAGANAAAVKMVLIR